MEIRVRPVDDFLPPRVLDESVPDVPFLRDGPIEHRSAAGHLVDLKRIWSSDDLESPSHPVAGHAPADRIQLGDQIVHPSTRILERDGLRQPRDFPHGYTLTSGMGVINRPPHFLMWAICAMILSWKFQGRIRT